MSKWNYVASAHKSSAVVESLTAGLTSADQRNLILAKGNRLELYKLSEEGLVPLQEISILGMIKFVHKLSAPQKDYLLIVTQPYAVSIATYEANTISILESAQIQEPTRTSPTALPLASLDPYERVYVLHLFTGLLRVIQITDQKSIRTEFNVRLEEDEIRDIQILDEPSELLLGVIYSKKTEFVLKVYSIKLQGYSMEETTWVYKFQHSTCKIISSPGKVGVLHEAGVVVYDLQTGNPMSFNAHLKEVTSCNKVDSNRWILGNTNGEIYLLCVNTGIELKLLGQCVTPNSITYLDNNYFFVGSSTGDSSLIKVLEQQENGSYIKVVQSYPNLAPMLDFLVLEGEKKGNSDIIACAGHNLDGSIRLVNKGVGIYIEQEAELGKIESLWSLKLGEHYSHLVLSFFDKTRILRMNETELEPVEYSEFQSNTTSLYISTLSFGIVQVTPEEVAVYNFNWEPFYKLSPGGRISLGDSSNDHLVLVMDEDSLVSYSLTLEGYQETGRWQAPYEVSSVCMEAELVAVGLWTEMSICVLFYPSFTLVKKEVLGGDVFVRSLLFAEMENIKYLFAGLADGHLLTYTLPDFFMKSVLIGNQQVTLKEFNFQNCNYVFASCDQPAVAYSTHQRVFYASVNTEQASCMAPFYTEAFPDCLALVSGMNLVMISIEEIQRFSIRTFPMGMTVRRIGALEECFVCLGYFSSGRSCLLLLNQNFMVMDTYEFPETEVGNALHVNGEKIYAGSYITDDPQNEPTKGVIYVFVKNNERLTRVQSEVVEGSVSCLGVVQQKYLVAGVNSYIHYYSLEHSQISLIEKDQKLTYIIGMDTFEELVAFLDITRSVSVFRAGEKLVPIAKNLYSLFPTAVQFISREFLLVSDMFCNVHLLTFTSGRMLSIVGAYYLGEMVNHMRRGSLIQGGSEDLPKGIESVLLGTTKGCLVVVVSLPYETYEVLFQLQSILGNMKVKSQIWQLSKFRSPQVKGKPIPWEGFLDGDFIEGFLSLSPQEQSTVCMEVSNNLGRTLTPQELQRLVLALSKVH